jgi:tetratricopeptide (TPR) repeat protein
MVGKRKRRKSVSRVLNEWLYEVLRKLGSFFSSVSDFSERLIGEGLLGSGKSLKKLSSFLPWRSVVAAGKFVGVLWGAFCLPFVWVSSRMAALAERLLPKWLSRGISWPFTASARALVVTFDFASLWWWSREFKKLLWAIPAFVMAAPLIACMILSPLYSRSAKLLRYQQTMQEAINSDNQPLADLCVAKLNQLGHHQMERAAYAAAIALEDKGQIDAAREKMEQMASAEVPGYAPAHCWIALRLMAGALQDKDTNWELIETHVRHALHADRDYLPARRILVEIDLHHGRTEQAVEAMQSLVVAFPDLNYRLMRYFETQGDVVEARSCAREVIAYSKALHGDGQPMAVDDFLRWAAAHEQLGEPDAAVQVMDRALLQHPNPELTGTLRNVLLTAYRMHVDVRPSEAFAYLRRAIELDPANDQVLVFLANHLINGDSDAIEFLGTRTIDDDLSLRTQLLAGDLLFRRKDYPSALKFYSAGCVIDPQTGRGWNNSAWILANAEPVRLDEALAAANRAIGIESGNPEFLETRGQILLKLKRWQEAVNDLSGALNGNLANAADIHRALAIAYEELGQREQANAHRLRSGG